MLFMASFWWLWVILTVVLCFTVLISGFFTFEEDSKTGRIVFFISLPLTISGVIITVISIILAIIQFIKS